MAEVTVDMKPMERLPYDPNDIPEAVRKRAAAVDALYTQQSTQPPQPPQQIQQPVVSAPVEQVSVVPGPVPPTTQPPSAPAPEDSDPNSNSWKHQALAHQGRLEQANKDLGELQEKYYNEVVSKQQA